MIGRKAAFRGGVNADPLGCLRISRLGREPAAGPGGCDDDDLSLNAIQNSDDYIDNQMWNYVYLNAGLTIRFNGEKFYSKNGLLDLLQKDEDVMAKLTKEQLEDLFDLDYHFKQVDTIFERVFGRS